MPDGVEWAIGSREFPPTRGENVVERGGRSASRLVRVDERNLVRLAPVDDGHDLAAGNGLVERLDVDAEVFARNADDEEAVERRVLDDGRLVP